jgi:GntR family transcriptional repressor for pyruvate dehydrogenase complex
MRSLVARHFLEVRPGNGTIITGPTTETLARSITQLLRFGGVEYDVDKVLEVRRFLEIEIARLAAERRTPEDIRTLAAILAISRETRDDPEKFAKADVDFHMALAKATHNELFCALLDSISYVMVQVRLMGFGVPGTPARGLMHHQAVFEQVQRGDPELARRAMQEHMVEAEATMRSAVALIKNKTGLSSS